MFPTSKAASGLVFAVGRTYSEWNAGDRRGVSSSRRRVALRDCLGSSHTKGGYLLLRQRCNGQRREVHALPLNKYPDPMFEIDEVPDNVAVVVVTVTVILDD